MKILVTGGAGFIGSHLVDALLERGEEVVCVDDFNDFYDPAIKRKNIEGAQGSDLFRLYELDIRDADGVRRVLRDESPEVVCHLAARAGVRPSINDPMLYEEVNCMGTLNILEALRGTDLKHFVFAGSSSVYGINSKVPFSEDDPISRPISPYATTKRAGELMCYTYSHLYGLPVTSLRFFTVYGERGRPEMAVAKFTKLIHQGLEIEVYGDGTIKRDFTYIGDIISGLMASVYNPFRYEIINLGGSRVVELGDVIAAIEKSLGKKARIKYLDPAPGDVPITYADVRKAEKLFGYEPEVAIEEGVERYVRWFLENEGVGGVQT